ncbi:MAG TPA: hypothetical protein DCZ72_08520 [Armatimonadetes bacterium]|nr:hypothetical protein [Armatimonadota bacterium]
MATGTVKWYDTEKGYGFVYEDNANRDVFLHSADIDEPEPKTLYEGHRVRFEVEDSDRGPRATNVTVLTGTETVEGQAAEAAAAAEQEVDPTEVFDPTILPDDIELGDPSQPQE